MVLNTLLFMMVNTLLFGIYVHICTVMVLYNFEVCAFN